MKYEAIFLIAGLLVSPQVVPTSVADNGSGQARPANKDEVVTGRETDDKIITGDGNDNISATGGNDFIEAGEGNDLISGGAGDDKIQGGPGDDYIMGGDGDDTVSDGPGNDFINLGSGNDTFVYYLDSNKGYTDYAVGGEGEDTLIIVSDNIDDMMKNEILKYYEKQNMVGTDIAHLGKFDVSLGVSQFEHVVVATSFAF